MEEDDSDDDNLAVWEFVVFCIFVFKRCLSSFVVFFFFFVYENDTIE